MTRVAAGDLARQIESRLGRADVARSASLIESLTAYLELLARWNQKINLTAFDLTAPSDAAIDRLIVEPVEAARFAREEDRVALDVGSGGGSPALPLRLAAPWLRMTLVEARTRKSAFLREAVRVLELKDVAVETFRFEPSVIPKHLAGAVDLVTIRGVKSDDELLDSVSQVLSEVGRLLVFGQLVVNQKKDGQDDMNWRSVVHALKSGSDVTVVAREPAR